MQKKIKTTWEIWTYDVWGNKRDGYEVNDRFCINRNKELILKVESFNTGTPREFESASPSDYAIKKIFGVSCDIESNGDDTQIFVERKSDGLPVGELNCTSHKSLSPIYWHYTYTVDLNERGIFKAHVDDADDNTVFSLSNEDSEDGELDLIRDGYMKHTEDKDGLLQYLGMVGIIPNHNTVMD